MQLYIKRGQYDKKGWTGSDHLYTLDLRLEMTQEERDAWKGQGVTGLIYEKPSVSLGSLISGQHIEGSSIAELMAIEDRVKEACNQLRDFLDRAMRYNGAEEVLDL